MEEDRHHLLVTQLERLMYGFDIDVPTTPKIDPIIVVDPPPLNL
jgi:hypothetical protein